MNVSLFSILAQATEQVAETPPLVPPDQSAPESMFIAPNIEELWGHIVNISWLHALFMLAAGVIYLMYGWRIFRVIVVINFSLIGVAMGVILGGRAGSAVWGGIFGAFLVGSVSLPLMKYAVSVLGIMAGAILGAAVWRSLTLPDPLMWVGALSGGIAGGFMAFSSFKTSIILFTSLQGAMALGVGLLALLAEYPNFDARLSELALSHSFLLPAFLVVPTCLGFYLQQRLLRTHKDFALPE